MYGIMFIPHIGEKIYITNSTTGSSSSDIDFCAELVDLKNAKRLASKLASSDEYAPELGTMYVFEIVKVAVKPVLCPAKIRREGFIIQTKMGSTVETVVYRGQAVPYTVDVSSFGITRNATRFISHEAAEEAVKLICASFERIGKNSDLLSESTGRVFSNEYEKASQYYEFVCSNIEILHVNRD